MQTNVIVKFSVLLCIAAVLYVLASYMNIAHPQPNMTKAVALASSIAALEYLFKVPAYNLVKTEFPPAIIHVIWIVVAFFATNLFQEFYMHKKVKTKVWMGGFIIIAVVADLCYDELRSKPFSN